METARENVPTAHEVERQLDWMLRSDLFVSAPRLSPLLSYIVRTTLPDGDGRIDPVGLTEHQIGFAVFEDYTPDKSAVRVNATFLRTRLAKYYADSGADDLVRIDIPPGGYRAVFSYNRTSPAARLCSRGWLEVGEFRPSEQGHRSLRLFVEAVAADPNHAPAHAAKAEAELRETMYRRTIPPHDPIEAAEASAREALRLHAGMWRAHIVMGVVHCCRRSWLEAEKSFNAALASAPTVARNHAWYSAFLLATGREEKGLRLMKARAEEAPEDAFAQAALGFFLYVARRFGEAEVHLCEAVERFPKNWLLRIAQACVFLASERATEALWSIERAQRLLYEQSEFSEPRENVFPGLHNLCRLRGGDEADRRFAREKVKDAMQCDAFAVHELRHASGEVPGDYDGWDAGEFDKHIPFWTPLQMALGYIGIDEKEKAIASLARGIAAGDPINVGLLRLLPLFDPLRDDPGFQRLIDSMNLGALLP